MKCPSNRKTLGMDDLRPTLMPLGDQALLVRFARRLEMRANQAAISLAHHLVANPPAGVGEIVPNLVSVLVRYDSEITSFDALAGALRLILGSEATEAELNGTKHHIQVRFGGAAGPDLEAVAAQLNLDVPDFIARHNAAPLQVLTTGFAPGFVYCGMHEEALHLPRRQEVRTRVMPGTILFAAGQTAITATAIPTGWHVIGQTEFRNFDPTATPPTMLHAGDSVQFEAMQ